MAFLTFGEGYHNFHHKFQWDYRNGIKWYNFDPSKWIIRFLSFFKITTNLIRSQESLIFKSKFDTSFHLLKSKIESMGSFYQDNYKSKIDDLFEKSNQILLICMRCEKKLIKEIVM
jgi:cytochrome b involved in lipid metabolism